MEQSKQEVQGKIDALVKDERADEARPLRAGLNIYDVFTALLDTAAKLAAQDEGRFISEFHNLAGKIPENWRKSLAAAKEHEDVEKALIEEAKLQTADGIIAKFDSLF